MINVHISAYFAPSTNLVMNKATLYFYNKDRILFKVKLSHVNLS